MNFTHLPIIIWSSMSDSGVKNESGNKALSNAEKSIENSVKKAEHCGKATPILVGLSALAAIGIAATALLNNKANTIIFDEPTVDTSLLEKNLKELDAYKAYFMSQPLENANDSLNAK